MILKAASSVSYQANFTKGPVPKSSVTRFTKASGSLQGRLRSMKAPAPRSDFDVKEGNIGERHRHEMKEANIPMPKQNPKPRAGAINKPTPRNSGCFGVLCIVAFLAGGCPFFCGRVAPTCGRFLSRGVCGNLHANRVNAKNY